MKYTKAEAEITMFSGQASFIAQSGPENDSFMTIETPPPDVSYYKCYIVYIWDYSNYLDAWKTECRKVEGFVGTVDLYCKHVK